MMRTCPECGKSVWVAVSCVWYEAQAVAMRPDAVLYPYAPPPSCIADMAVPCGHQLSGPKAPPSTVERFLLNLPTLVAKHRPQHLRLVVTK
jgi:hypothetical protein